ncbi:N-acetylglucosamine-6-phosphate deacetylase [Asticcacaulis sp. ZE23SCel15]|uniref:N-acetylglucosamine-6-phosphate deacetylase n=1 Tax=Asticcacaulis sp. ZE23SCel15 TaxID=3059027 RepID=UPI00265DAC6A|nr:N-acetylglucosamine-6-phosphate deacetylase [Asticcacaulis sp. ZE23SCel15]WKL58458.1 N-acetylglucosamine-6-phosphate deacetylase [Asticcacaulis sp. ZE23SCel15]
MSPKTTFRNGSILTPEGFVSDHVLTTVGDRIAHLEASKSASVGEVIDLDGGYLLPGFIDTQVNGGGGVLFNDDTSSEAIAAIGAAHRPFGTTGFLPTLISDELEVIDAAMRAVEQAIEDGVPGVLGIHIEGPFINEARKGTHDPAKFRTLTDQSLKLLSSLKHGKTLVTLAPETATSDDIRTLTQAGVIVAAGHTDASYGRMAQAFDEGVTGITHLFNAMSPFTHRAPGVVGAALENQSVYCGLIIDGRHVDPVALKIAVRCRPHDRFMIVTDAMPTVGSKTKTFMLQDKLIRVENGVCVGPDGTLAGSDLDMATAVKNAVEMVGLTLEEAAVMAATAPAKFLGLDALYGVLKAGARADLVWLDRDLNLKGVWIGGEQSLSQKAAA